MTLTDQLKSFCLRSGADLVGVAELEPFKRENYPTVPPNLLAPYASAISVAMALDKDVLELIHDRPTVEYAKLCRRTNVRLDGLTASIVKWIGDRGSIAEAVAAFGAVDTQRMLGAISHKAVARMAGIGWQGKSLLLVTPQFGPRVRLSTVLTDIPLTHDTPIRNNCGGCTKCTDACPARAIRNVSTRGHYASREEAVDIAACLARLKENEKIPGVDYTFCGVCIRACPWGK